jgi:hypothetical protein
MREIHHEKRFGRELVIKTLTGLSPARCFGPPARRPAGQGQRRVTRYLRRR